MTKRTFVKPTPSQRRLIEAECEAIRDHVREALMNSNFTVHGDFVIDGEAFFDESEAVDQIIESISYAARMQCLASQGKAFPAFIEQAKYNEAERDRAANTPVATATDGSGTVLLP